MTYKRIAALILFLALCAGWCAAATATSYYNSSPPGTGGTAFADQSVNAGSGEILLLADKTGNGVSPFLDAPERLTGETARRITDLLDNAPPSGTKDLRRIDSENPFDLRLNSGYFWIRTAGGTYRYDPAANRICRVEQPYGMGDVIGISDVDLAWILRVKQYANTDTYEGTLFNGTLDLRQISSAPSSVKIEFESYGKAQRDDPESPFLLTVKITAKEDLNTTIRLSSTPAEYGGCVPIPAQPLTMSAGEVRSVTLESRQQSSVYYLRCENVLWTIHLPDDLPDEGPDTAVILRSTDLPVSGEKTCVTVSGQSVTEAAKLLAAAPRGKVFSCDAFGSFDPLLLYTSDNHEYVWFRIGADLYRYSRYGRVICAVDSPLSAGVELKLGDKGLREITNLLDYAPYNSYYLYFTGSGKPSFSHTLVADTDAELQINDAHYETVDRRFYLHVNVTVTALEDLNDEPITLSKKEYGTVSEDGSARINLKKGDSETLTLICEINKSYHQALLRCENTQWEIALPIQ